PCPWFRAFRWRRSWRCLSKGPWLDSSSVGRSTIPLKRRAKQGQVHLPGQKADLVQFLLAICDLPYGSCSQPSLAADWHVGRDRHEPRRTAKGGSRCAGSGFFFSEEAA